MNVVLTLILLLYQMTDEKHYARHKSYFYSALLPSIEPRYTSNVTSRGRRLGWANDNYQTDVGGYLSAGYAYIRYVSMAVYFRAGRQAKLRGARSRLYRSRLLQVK